MKVKHLAPQFVESFPGKLEPGELYLAMEFATAAHLCACGCGTKVITPFPQPIGKCHSTGKTFLSSPLWAIDVSLPLALLGALGSYQWAGDMSQEAINAGRKRDAEAKVRLQGCQARRRDSSTCADITVRTPRALPVRETEEMAGVVIASLASHVPLYCGERGRARARGGP